MFTLYYWEDNCLRHEQFYFYRLSEVIDKAINYKDWHIENKNGKMVAHA